MVDNAPLTIALGAAAFAVLAMLVVRKLSRDSRLVREQAGGQIADLRAQLDFYEALLSSAREVTVVWTVSGGPPRIFGQPFDLLPPGQRLAAILDFSQWLGGPQADRLARAVELLRTRGQSFALSLEARSGQSLRLNGAALDGGAVLRIRPVTDPVGASEGPQAADAEMRVLLAGLDRPAFLRNADGEIGFANPAFDAIWPRSVGTRPASLAELVEPVLRTRHLETLKAGNRPPPMTLTLPSGGFELIELPLAAGSAGYLRPLPVAPVEVPPTREGRVAALVAALSIPAAIFDAKYQLIAFNRAYADLWKLGNWLQLGLDERTILDRLRREDLLPSEPDYRAWREKHLASYRLKSKGEPEPWHLPDGRTLEVTAAPAGPEGGVIYLFADISRELELMSQNRALASVQRSTLNALSDAVAVFGTNGRLQLFNPRLSAMWRLPTNFLEHNPHIDQVAAAVAAELPEDGATIWRDLKRAVIDLTPTRTDTQGRLTLADGRLLDYAVVRLPDGQKLMSFLDVTESANYNRMLKERNAALVTADRLKDAFVQNVSYELRSPLTNIIGFADLLASPDIGPLNDRQRLYTDYIRASSVTLGVLIDNILDLATVDAGIAELRPEPQDVAGLVEKARAGLAASFPEAGGGTSINLKVEIASNLPPLIADGTRIVQVLYNLLSSAARFSEPGGEVRLTATARGERIQFVVEDDGTGSEEMRAELLQAPDGIIDRQRGAGLGLAIVRAFVNLHGGTIAVEARRPRGTRVVVSLPRDATAAATTAAE
ncbi:MAG: PAS-domain containing protein [Devosia sp.]|nr:PAS-domain containing protein [Devosia sp.]